MNNDEGGKLENKDIVRQKAEELLNNRVKGNRQDGSLNKKATNELTEAILQKMVNEAEVRLIEFEMLLEAMTEELSFEKIEKAKLALELVIANKKLLFQNEEKSKHAEELVLTNIELLFQNQEKEKRAAELVVSNKLISSQHDRLIEIASLVPGVVYQYRLHPDGTSCFPYASDAIRQIYRVTPEEVREDASKVFSKIHPNDIQGVMISIRESAKNLSLWQHEYRMKFDDGAIRSLYGNAMPRAEADGSVLWYGFITDITDKKEIAHQLEERLKEFQVLYGLSQLAGEKDIALDVLYQRFVHILPEGWQYPEITCARIIVEGAEFRTENFEDTAWKQSAPIEVNGSVIGLIEVGYLKEMQNEYEGPFLKEERELIDSFASQLNRIIERKTADEKLFRSEAKYRLLFENMEEGFSLQEIITDENNNPVDIRFLDANAAYERQTGFKPGDIIGKTQLSILPQSDPRQIEIFGKVALTGEPVTFEYYSNTYHRHLRVKAFCPQPGQFATIFEDITQFKHAEQNLLDSEARYRSMTANISDVISIISADGLIKYRSPNSEKSFGWLPEDRVGMSGFSFIHPDDIENAQKAFYSILGEDDSVKTLELRYKCKDGSYKPVELTAANLLNDPLINGVLLNFRDITERKQMEEGKARQVLLINSLLDSIPDMIFFKNTEGVYLGCNPTFANFVGKSRSEIIGKTDHDLFEKAIADSSRQYDCEMLMQKLPRHNEEWITYPDGKKVLLDTLKTPYWAGDGSLIGSLGISRDITERNSAKEELKQLSTRLTLAIRSGGVGVWDYDIVNDHLVWDDQLFALYGVPKGDFRGAYQAWQAVLHPEDTERCDAEIQMAIRGEKEFDTEFRVVWSDGSIHMIRALATVQYDNFGKPMRMIGTNWDISAQKQSEQEIKLKNQELERINAGKDKFFSIIAHDLRGPLGGFMALTEMMADESNEFAEHELKKITLNL